MAQKNLFISVSDRPFIEVVLDESVAKAEKKLQDLDISNGSILKIVVFGDSLFCKTILSLQDSHAKSLKDRGVFEVFFDFQVQQNSFNPRIAGLSKTRDFAAVLSFYLEQLGLTELETKDTFLEGKKLLDEAFREDDLL